VKLTPDGKTLVVLGKEPPLRVWNLADEKEVLLQNRDWDSGAGGLGLTPDGRLLVGGSGGGIIRVWDPATRQNRSILRHEGPITAVGISPDGKVVVSAGGGRLKFWSVATKAVLADVPQGGVDTPTPLGLTFSPDGKQLAVSLPKRVQLWDMADLKLPRTEGRLAPPSGPWPDLQGGGLAQLPRPAVALTGYRLDRNRPPEEQAQD
jgi:WD40 repeat protein